MATVRPQDTGCPRQQPQVQCVETEGRRFVYFDLETTGLEDNCHITQIAACSGEDETFSTFVLPTIPIRPGAQEVTGITCNGQQMHHHGEPVPCLTVRPALEKFIAFLGEREPAVLLGHCIQRFDCPRLLIALQACDLVERFQDVVHGFVDTYPLFREINTVAGSYKLTALYKYYTGEDFPGAHDAREDVRALQRIVEKVRPDPNTFKRHSFTLRYVIENQR